MSTDQDKDPLKQRLAELREIESKATPGRWTYGAEALYAAVNGPVLKCHGVHENAALDARFIATARNSFLPLIDALEKAAKQLEFCAQQFGGMDLRICERRMIDALASIAETLKGERNE